MIDRCRLTLNSILLHRVPAVFDFQMVLKEVFFMKILTFLNGFIPPSTLIPPLMVLMLAMAGCGKQKQPEKPASVAEVVAVTVQPRDIPVSFPFVAQIQSSHQVDIMARVSGFLEKINYKEGEPVKKGQVLFQLDKKPFVAALNAAQAEVDARKSQLWTAKATLDRVKPLAEQNAASKSDLDNAIGNHKAAEAAVHQALANLDKAQLDLSYTTIIAPFDGITGQALVREGSYIASTGSNARLTYLATLDPLWVDFSISQNEQAKFVVEMEKGLIREPKKRHFMVELEMADGSRYPLPGLVNFAEPSFNKDTGTYLVRAQVANPKLTLRPGMFVKAWLNGMVRPNALVVPQRAVQQTSNGHVVFVVSEKGAAEVRPVVTGEWSGNDWIITQGLKGGDRVIVEGLMRLTPGETVKVVSAEELQKSKQAPQSASGK